MGLSDTDRSLLVVMSRVLEPAMLHAFAATLHTLATSPSASAFDDLPADADEPTRQDLAERVLPITLDIRSLLPGLSDATPVSAAAAAAARTVDVALGDLYNPAQVDVLRRIRRLRRSRRPLPRPSDPYPLYARFREQGPAVYLPERDIWLISTYAAVLEVLRDHRGFRSGLGTSYERVADSGFRAPFIDNDPPDHTRIRRSVQGRFHRAEIEKLTGEVRHSVDEITAEPLARGTADVVTAIAQRLPDLTMRRFTGITRPDPEKVAEPPVAFAMVRSVFSYSRRSVGLSLVVSHFPSKDGLYYAIFKTRQYINDDRVARLAAVTDTAAPDALDRVVAAFVDPILAPHDTPDDASFARLILRETADPSSQARTVIGEMFDPMARAFIAKLEEVLPDHPPGFHAWAYLFSAGALTQSSFDARLRQLASPEVVTRKDEYLRAYITAALRQAH